jgi:beta-glucosidase
MTSSTEEKNTVDQRVEALLAQMTLQEKVALLSGQDAWRTASVERLGIPSLTMTDGPHGVRANDPIGEREVSPATSFPTGISMAASWDPELVERVGAALARETRALGCDILLGPCVNIVRTPLAGRNFESYAEDPYLAGQIGVAWVKGLQSQRVGASLKHYACNNQEIERMRGDSIVDERTLREIYLPQFETVVKKAAPWTVMCAYNRINGEYASQHHHLLTEILKEEWGFEGVVVSDWGANHTIFESVAGGLDLEMPGPALYYGRLLERAVQTWQIDEDAVTEAARRVLRMVAISGKLDDAPLPEGAVNTPEHQALARELAEASITLLKNAGDILPLRDVETVAVIGPNAAECRIGGGGSSYLEPPYRVSPLEGLRAKLGDAVEIGYAPGCDNFAELPGLPAGYFHRPDGEGQGLLLAFFNNTELAGDPVATQVTARIEDWRIRAPGVVDTEAFSARWTGTLRVPMSGRYALKLRNAGTARLYLDGELVLETAHDPEEAWLNQVAATARELEADRDYAIKVEFVKTPEVTSTGIYLQGAYAPVPDDRQEQAVALAKDADVALIFAGMPKGFESEGHDRPDMKLPGGQDELIEAVAAANPNTVVVINAGAPVAMPWAAEVAGIVMAYYPGQEGGNAVANVLTGAVNPSGKLPVTLPHRYLDNPTAINYPGTREVRYGEGIFVGYRYYDAKDVAPLFPFGHGLSYTTFEYSDLQAPARVQAGETFEVSVTVANTGDRAGQEVVQLYVADVVAAMARPPQELKGFAKVDLAPGERQTLTFQLDPRALSFYDPHQRRWIAEPGVFQVLVGSSSRDIRAKRAFTLEDSQG